MSLTLLNKVKKLKKLKADRAALARQGMEVEVVDEAPAPTISLAEFVQESWHVLEPTTRLEWNWHLDVVCEHIEYVLRDWQKKQADPNHVQKIQNLLINIPPGSGKSRIASVCTPAWFWLYQPSWRALFLSANPRVALRDAVYCKDVIVSDWYTNTFKPSWKLRSDNNSKSSFWNTAGGFRNAFGFNSVITGDRGDCLMVDDPHDANEAESDVKRKSVLERWDGAIQNRVNDLRSSVRIGIMQRVHEKDWAGHVMAKGTWGRLQIRQEYELRTEPTALGWEDPRSIPGELMFEERFPRSVLEGQKSEMGERKYAAQHQQNPAPSGGNMFKIRNWRIVVSPLACKRFVLSLDASFKGGAANDNVAIATVGQTDIIRMVDTLGPVASDGGRRLIKVPQYRYYVRNLWADKAGITKTQSELIRVSKENPDAFTKLIEDKANGPAIIQQMSSVLSGITEYNPGRSSKEERAAAIEPIQERGDICIPGNAEVIGYLQAQRMDSITIGEWWDLHPPKHESNAEYTPVPLWVKELINECASFPNGDNDDRVDALDQAINWMEQNKPSFGWGTGRARYGS